MVKEILTAEDAALAVESGADAIIVSNHGGRTLDGATPTLLAFPRSLTLLAAGYRCSPTVVSGVEATS